MIKVQVGELSVEYIHSEENVVDRMIKPLLTTQFEDLKIKIIVLAKP